MPISQFLCMQQQMDHLLGVLLRVEVLDWQAIGYKRHCCLILSSSKRSSLLTLAWRKFLQPKCSISISFYVHSASIYQLSLYSNKRIVETAMFF